MILGVPLWALVVIALALLVGTMVQVLVGLGLVLVGAPITTLVAPAQARPAGRVLAL